VQLFRKAIARIGKFVDQGGKRFEITAAHLSHWATTFRKMKRAGIEVGIPSSHDAEFDSRENMGRVVDMWPEGDRLIAKCECVGDDAIRAATRNNCSINSPVSWRDGEGRTWKQAITHLALTPRPIIPGLESFVPIEASHRKDAEMEEFLKKLKEMLGLKEAPADEEAALVAIKASFEAGSSERKELEKTITQLKKKSKKGEPKDEGDPKPTPQPDGMTLSLALENRGAKITRLLEQGRIKPSQAKKLAELFIGEQDAAADESPLVLSFQKGWHGVFDSVMTVLEENPAVKTDESTGIQSLRLGQDIQGKEDSNLLYADMNRRRQDAGLDPIKL
jgi:hypothetical protein